MLLVVCLFPLVVVVEGNMRWVVVVVAAASVAAFVAGCHCGALASVLLDSRFSDYLLLPCDGLQGLPDWDDTNRFHGPIWQSSVS